MSDKIDKKYRDDFDYINEIKKFSRKDMLKLALYQEWVKRRYTKPDSKRSIVISIVGLLLGAVALTWKLKDEPTSLILMLIADILLGLSALAVLKEHWGEQKLEVDKLNAIRNAIEKLSD